MMTANDEEVRLRKLYEYNLLDTPREETFDRITRLAAAALNVPIAAVTLVDRDRQWFKSQQGLAVSETPREQSFCAHAMFGAEPMVVPDATLDSRFRANPLVTSDPEIRFYVGVPLLAADGTALGALCAIDRKPRDVRPIELAMLGDLANLTMEQLELRLLATRDGLTGTMRREPFMISAERDLAMARRQRQPLACLMIDVDNFKKINDQWGHAAGDEVLVRIAAAVSAELGRGDKLGRIGGEEFCVISPDTDLPAAMKLAERVRAAVATVEVDAEGRRIGVTASVGVAQLESSDTTPTDVLRRADAALYGAKRNGRDRVSASAS